jgi:hypothetical protein
MLVDIALALDRPAAPRTAATQRLGLGLERSSGNGAARRLRATSSRASLRRG